MNVINRFTNIPRSPGDPEVLSRGPSSRGAADQLARALGWVSIALGVAELVAPARINRALGLEHREMMVRASGAREIAAGVLSLSVDTKAGIASRVVGDVLDIASLVAAHRSDKRNANAVALALAGVVALTILDIVCLRAVHTRHRRERGTWRDYSDRSGLPRGVNASRGLAREGIAAATVPQV